MDGKRPTLSRGRTRHNENSEVESQRSSTPDYVRTAVSAPFGMATAAIGLAVGRRGSLDMFALLFFRD